MATQSDTGISWTDVTWNPIRGCSKVSPGCRNCYAEVVAARFSGPGQPYEHVADAGGWNRLVLPVPPRDDGTHALTDPLRWRRPRMVFVNSMSDLFHETLDDAVIDVIVAVMALAGRHTFQVLTKRADRMSRYTHALSSRDGILRLERAARSLGYSLMFDGAPLFSWPLPNVWWGVSVESQEQDERVVHLMDTLAAVRFVSAEPLLAPLDFEHDTEVGILSHLKSYRFDDGPMGSPSAKVDWVIVGGESGPLARPMHPSWVRAIRDQCVAAGTAFHFKQWGEWAPIFESDADYAAKRKAHDRIVTSRMQRFLLEDASGKATGCYFERVGKKRAGHLLDGVEWQQFPARMAA